MNKIKKKIYILISMLAILLVNGLKVNSFAATKTAEVITLDEEQDISICFTFDEEVVDLTLISPSGERITKNNTDKVEYDEDKLWSVYLIRKANKGTWKVEYDLGKNKEINFSVITEKDDGIWIQNVEQSLSSNRLTVNFEADSESIEEYSYAVYAVDINDESKINLLGEGRAASNEEIIEKYDIKNLASGTYRVKLDVNAIRGEGEVFDSLSSEETFIWSGKVAKDVLDGFLTIIDEGNLSLSIDWKGFRNGTLESEKLTVYADSNLIYDSELDGSTGETSTVFPEGTALIKISLSAKKDGLWSEPVTKEITLGNEYLRLLSSDITGNKNIELAYKTEKESELYVVINGEKGSYTIKGENTIFFEISDDINDIEASFDTDNDITYVVNKSVFHDMYPPEIKLYEDLDGRTFYTDNVNILGKITGASILKLNGEEVPFEGNSFSVNVPLSLGENLVEIEAFDEADNSSKMLLTLYRDTEVLGGINKNKGLRNFIPLGISLGVSLILIIYSLIFMKKKVKEPGKKKHKIWKWILWDMLVILADSVCVWQLVKRYMFANSLDFLELAEKSVAAATKYMKLMYGFGIGAAAFFVTALISVLLTLFFIKRNKKINAEVDNNEE